MPKITRTELGLTKKVTATIKWCSFFDSQCTLREVKLAAAK